MAEAAKGDLSTVLSFILEVDEHIIINHSSEKKPYKDQIEVYSTVQFGR